jgi:bifunctional DNA primase/polymerase-like protein/AAA domain-containing protein/primase-like protein
LTDVTIDEAENPRNAAAIALAERGFHVFPVKAGEKRPDPLLAPNGFKDSTRDPATIAGWFDVRPKCNVGIACGAAYNLLVLDVDVKNGARGLKTLEALGANTLTLTANTPSGGFHLYLSHPGQPVRAKLDGIDVKGADGGGYVVAPPSSLSEAFAQEHSCAAGPYGWRDEEIPVAAFPSGLLEALRVNGKANGAASVAPATAKVGNGRRNNYLSSIAGILRRDGFGERHLDAVLQIENQEKCDPPLPANEVAAVARSIARYEPERPLEPEVSEPLTILSTLELRRLGKAAPVVPLLDPVLAVAGSMMIYSATGVGKSHIGLCIAGAIALGRSFLDWAVADPLPVLYIDGEMPLGELDTRIGAYFGDEPLERLSWIAARARKEDLPDLADPAGQELYFAAICAASVKVAVFDNLSCLRLTSADLPENAAEAWQPITAFIRRLNRMGVAVILIHHANRAGGYRGSSNAPAPFDTLICLQAIKSDQADPLAENDLEIIFEKHRLFTGEAAQPFRAKAIMDIDGREHWQRVGADALVDDVVRLRLQGMSIRNIAQALQRSKAGIQKAITRAKARALLPLGGSGE